MIKIIGMGNDAGDLSLRAHNAVLSADAVIAKTAKVKSFGYFAEHKLAAETLDGIYGKSRSFDTLYKNLGDEVIRRAKGVKTLCYCVEGSGTDDRSAAYILEKCPGTEVFPACEKGSELLARSNSSSCAVYAAYDFAGQSYHEIDGSVPLLIREIDSAMLAAEVKLRLFSGFSEETEVLFSIGGTVRKIPLFELDRQESYDYSCAVLLLPEELSERKRFNFKDLVDIVVRLRAPDGCPWDREQNHDTIRMNLIEEAYEALEAVELNDPDKMREEMGDLLLQPLFHAVMAEESGEFTVSDMLSELCGKLVFRHSHIFGKDHASGGAEALEIWEKNKNVEKNQTSVSDEIRDVPKNFPALLYAYKIQKKAKKAGLEFLLLENPAKLSEEFDNLKETKFGDVEGLDALGGKMLFMIVDIMRNWSAEPELALRHEADRFAARVTECERLARENGAELSALSDSEKKELWKQAEGAWKTAKRS